MTEAFGVRAAPSGSLWRPQNETLQYEQSPTIRRETLLHLSVGAMKHPHLYHASAQPLFPNPRPENSPLLGSSSTQSQRHSYSSSLDEPVALHRSLLHLPSSKDEALLLDGHTRAIRYGVLEGGEVGGFEGERVAGEISNEQMHG